MNSNKIILILLICLLALPSAGLISADKNDESEKGGKLRDFSEPYKEDPKPDKPSKPAKEEHKEKSKSSNDDDDDDWDEDDDESFEDILFDIFLEICWAVVSAPFRDYGYRYNAPPYKTDDHSRKHYINYNPISDTIAAYKPISGTALAGSQDDTGINLNRQIAFQSRIYFQRIDKDNSSYGMYSKLLLPSGCAFDITKEHFLEELDSGNHDTMEYSACHLTFAGMSPDTKFNTEIGIGAITLTDANGQDHDGSSYLLRTDVFPKEQPSVRFLADFARVTGRSLTKLELTFGWHRGNMEIFTGYNTLINSQGRNLGGPVFGAAIWF